MDVEFCQILFLHLLRRFLSFIIMLCITLIDLQMLNHPCIPEMDPTRSWCMIPFVYSWIWFANILLRIFCICVHQGSWPVLFSSHSLLNPLQSACHYPTQPALVTSGIHFAKPNSKLSVLILLKLCNTLTQLTTPSFFKYFFSWIWGYCPKFILFYLLGCAPHLLSWYLLISPTLNMGVRRLRPYNIFLVCLHLSISRIML